MPTIQLVVVEGPDAGKGFDLSGVTTIGRDPGAGIAIEDSDASRSHASLSLEGTTVTVADLGSTNGTFVNEERLSAARVLGPTDKLRIGATVFELRVGALPDDLQATAARQAPDIGGPAAPGPPAAGPPPPAYAPPAAPPPGGQPAPYYSGGLTTYPVHYEADYPEAGIARWRCFFQWLLLIPHFVVLWFILFGALLAFIAAWVAIIVTRRYPPGIFNFLVGSLRWGARVNGYSYLMTEQYPPFSLEDVPYPIRLRIDYPESGIARWRPFLHYFMALPHLFILYVLLIGASFALIGAWFAILFTRRYPPGIFQFVIGVQRWQLRVQAYVLLMTEQYPPFSLD